MLELAQRTLPVLGFLLGMTLVAELADRAGLFLALAHRLARIARGSVPVLWLGLVVVAAACTAFLSLDTTAVLLTPVVLALARRLRIDPRLFAYTCVVLANTGSLFLPVSNLTNLLAMSAHSLSTQDFLALMWAPGVVGVVLPAMLLAIMFRHTLRTAADPDVDADEPRGGPLLIIVTLIVAGLAAAILAGADVTLAALLAAAALLLATAVLDPVLLRRLPVPWQMIIGVAALFVVVQLARDAFLDGLLATWSPASDLPGLLGLAGLGALTANLINNLPAYLALEGLTHSAPGLTAALLIGVNAGPLITPWASLATILWAGRCRAAGVPVRWAEFVARGAIIAIPTVAFGVAALILGS
ncbi:SLC13 family permease [Naumannella huperziae]